MAGPQISTGPYMHTQEVRLSSSRPVRHPELCLVQIMAARGVVALLGACWPAGFAGQGRSRPPARPP
eukprot:5150976-Alexandrium_andersonii.AAC.1